VDLRERVVGAIEEGASRREAAERFEVSVASAVRWFQAWQKEGNCTPKPRGGSRSVLEDYAEDILALVEDHADWTLAELVEAMGKRRIPGSRSALGRFFERHAISLKKKPCEPPNKPGRTWLARGDAGYGSRACLILPVLSSSMRRR
jgi:transposase